ncbi:transposase [Granulicella aggregans]|uniref:Transposase n=1 Tax=Granulicella aggregans TaxID=474949 RepID=A0A7W7ZF60_9BACT|nr:transposase [Granulicella aggregans]MBB5058845.1 transposase [Granulicella aggregans]
MIELDLGAGLGFGSRRRRSAAERRRVVEETLEAGASVAKVALKHGVNANQVFQWRRLYRDGNLGAIAQSNVKLLPVSSGSIHIELPGEIRISLEGCVDPAIVRAVLKSLRS